jgi:aminotransferase EvaB
MTRASIKMFDYLAELAEIHGDVMSAVDKVLRSGMLILGPEVERFEKSVAEGLGGGHAVGVASGTDALIVAMLAHGVKPGDEVITVANTAVATANAITRAGAVPVFCEVDRDTALMDIARVEELITPRTRAVIPVHLYGNAVDVPALRQRLAGRDLFVLEDCAQAMGGTLRGQPIGSLGDAAAFSFYPTKNLGAYGDGGLVFTKNAALADVMRETRRYGFTKRDYAGRAGMNSRLDELHAAILSVKLPRLEANVSARRKLAAVYDRELPARVKRIRTVAGVEHARHLYVIEVDDRACVQARLVELGVDTGVHYAHALHTMPGFPGCRTSPGGLPNTEALCARVLSLPLHPALSEQDVVEMCRAVESATA